MNKETDIHFAFPSKGRIRTDALEHFGKAAFQQTNERSLQIKVQGIDNINGSLLPAAEIAHQLKRGSVHLGITGDDLVRDISSHWDDYIVSLARLPFAYAHLVVAVPKSWVDVVSMEDLDDAAIRFRQKHGRRMRFATKYPHLTRQFFSRHGLIDYRIVENLGATEAAPANQTAEAICDLTSSGESLRNNGLKTLSDGTILESQAGLFASRVSPWNEEKKETARLLLEKMKLPSSAALERL